MYVMIDNYDSFTYNIYQYLMEITDQEVRVFRNDAVSPVEIEGLEPRGIIISPGPGNPDDAGISLDVIRYFKNKVPILGICLGHQCIGQSFGGRIIQAERIVHGKTEAIGHDGRGLFRGIPSPATFTRYHSLAIDSSSLPDCLEVTATASDGEIMGLRHRELPIEGVQFHPESIASETGKQILWNFLNYRLEPYPFRENLRHLIAGNDLSRSQAAGFMRELTEGNLSSTQIGGYLVALNAKGVTSQEIAGCASVLREKRLPLSPGKAVLDTCGTGGDGQGTFNISSMAALVASACGAPVAKHGNRAVSSKSGSSEFYRELGVKIDISPKRAEEMIESCDFAFLFAPIYHSAMRFAGPPRKELGIKTIMNMLGPLVNPAGAQYQLIGVFDEGMCLRQAQAAHLLGTERVMVVHGSDGLDELTVTGTSRVVMIDEEGSVRDFVFDPREIGLAPYSLEELKGGSPGENAEEARRVMAGGGRAAVRDAVCLNAGAALFVYGIAESIEDGYKKAKAALESGAVKEKLDEVIRLSNEQA